MKPNEPLLPNKFYKLESGDEVYLLDASSPSLWAVIFVGQGFGVYLTESDLGVLRKAVPIGLPTVPRMKIVYTNWKKETGVRRIIPLRTWFGTSEFHPEQQWFMMAYDMEKKASRTFALKDIKAIW